MKVKNINIEEIKSLTEKGKRNLREQKYLKEIERIKIEKEKERKEKIIFENRKNNLYNYCIKEIKEAASKGKSELEIFNGRHDEKSTIAKCVINKLKQFNSKLELREVECNNFINLVYEIEFGNERTWWETHEYLHFSW